MTSGQDTSQEAREHSSGSHTPGPWFASFRIWTGGSTVRDDGGCFQILDNENESSANVLCTRNPWPERADEMRANARLIAAAPDLLAFAQWLLEAYHSDEGMPQAKEIAREARATIEAATGSASKAACNAPGPAGKDEQQ